MKRFFWIVTAVMVALAVVACSSSEERAAPEAASPEQAEPRKSAVRRFTDETAEKMERKIRTPIDKAKATRDLGDERTEAMDQALRESGGE